jgi:hypothetical protein
VGFDGLEHLAHIRGVLDGDGDGQVLGGEGEDRELHDFIGADIHFDRRVDGDVADQVFAARGEQPFLEGGGGGKHEAFHAGGAGIGDVFGGFPDRIEAGLVVGRFGEDGGGNDLSRGFTGNNRSHNQLSGGGAESVRSIQKDCIYDNRGLPTTVERVPRMLVRLLLCYRKIFLFFFRLLLCYGAGRCGHFLLGGLLLCYRKIFLFIFGDFCYVMEPVDVGIFWREDFCYVMGLEKINIFPARDGYDVDVKVQDNAL